ncbi:MAG: aminopeptidase [Candidatus Nomurabacteria bacterium]|nr:aminopeptidase [Candidatus Nomurabacteria bacterium]
MYKLSDELLNKYARVMVHYGLNHGKGINKGETVLLVGQECTKDLFVEISKEIWRAGGNVLHRYLPDEVERYGTNKALLEIGTDEQLAFFPEKYWQGIADQMDHIIFIIAEPDIHALEGVPANKIAIMNAAKAPFMEMRTQKERLGKFSWTLCLYGTQSAADEVGMTLEEYWEQIINACYLRDEDPVATWKHTQAEIKVIRDKMDAMQIQKVHIKGADVDLHITIGEHRRWKGGSGANIPSFEIFTSPDWRGTNGTISFNQPLYYSGKRVSGVSLAFKDGVVITATATKNEETLLEMIANENANKIGEFSLTDRRHSRITRSMAETLYDENIGGEEGNTHIALGDSYEDTFDGDTAGPTDEEWAAMGFNKCPKVHTDIISTTNRTVTATLKDGTETVIYKDGQFTFV